jgi:sugar lactone lactonase YvrE
VNEYTPGGTLVQTLVQNANLPTGLAFDGQGNLYVTEFLGDDILKVDALTGQVSVFSNDSILGDGTTFNSPESIAFGPGYTKMYVSDANREGAGGGIHVIDTATGKGIGFYPLPSSSGSEGTGESDWLAFDSSGSLYMTNENPTQGVMIVDQATGDINQPSFIPSLPDYGYSMSFDASGNLWLADSTAVLEYDASGTLLQTITDANFTQIFASAYDPSSGTNYFGDLTSGGVFGYDQNGNVVDSFTAASGVEGLAVAKATTVPSAFSFNAKFGNPFSGTIATLASQIAQGSSIGDYSAAISWGDGSVTPATLSTPAPGSTSINVAGSHTYWIPGPAIAGIRLVNNKAGTTTLFGGTPVIASKYAGLGDSYSSGEGSGWPPGRGHPRLPGCDFSLYKDPSGTVYPTSGGSTDHINGATWEYVFPLGKDCSTDDTPKPLTGNTCHRSTSAYAHVVQRLLAINGMTLTFVACSGDVVQDAYQPGNAVHHDKLHMGEHPQIDALNNATSLVTLTFGGNNLGFKGDVTTCVTPFTSDYTCLAADDGMLDGLGYTTTLGNADDGTFNPADYLKVQGTSGNMSVTNLTTMTDHLLGTGETCLHPSCDLHDALVLLYRAIKARAPGATILVLGYPRFFDPGSSGCEHFSAFEESWINDRVNIADQVIQDAADESGVAQYVDVYDSLNGHGMCAGDPQYTIDPHTGQVAPCTGQWINGINIAGKVQLGSPELVHPNPCGHQAEGQLVATAYATPSPIDAFQLAAGQGQTTAIGVPTGTGRLNVTAAWQSGDVGLTLTDPNGTPYTAVQQGPVYATWDVPAPAAGTWSLTETNQTVGDSGMAIGTVSATFDSIPVLSAAGTVTMHDKDCILTRCTATFVASVPAADQSSITGFAWFSDKADPQSCSGPLCDTITMTSNVDKFRIILQTTGVSGEVRYTFASFG